MQVANTRPSNALEDLRRGFVGPFADAFVRTLQGQGLSRLVVREHVRAVARFGRWASRRGHAVEQLDEQVIDAYGRHLRAFGRRSKRRINRLLAYVRHFIDYLRGAGDPSLPVPPSLRADLPPLLRLFDQWMLRHRGVSEVTLEDYSRSLRELVATLGSDPHCYEARALRAFVVDYERRHGQTNARIACSAVRMFLRFLIAEGQCLTGLDAAVPVIVKWRLAALPRYLPAGDVERVVASADTSTVNGLRDRAVLLLLARLGLRSRDIVKLRLSDIDWEGASLRLQGKGRREARLPLTQELGDALLAYLEHARPPGDIDAVFLRPKDPIGPWTRSQTVGAIVARAIRRAGVRAPSHGAMVLRHSAATEMLRQGASLHEIGLVLRHRSSETTCHYAKVDVALLKTVAQPWPKVTAC